MDQCLDALLRLDYPDFEVLVITDEPASEARDPVRYLASGAVGPADKRDQGARESKGTILAFIDDDAYPDGQWLRKAVEVFADPQVAAVGGPGVTPPEDGFLARASGWISSSYLGGGVQRYRFIPEKARWVDDYPSMNFLVRRSAFEEAGGFGTHFFPGEDTKLCLAIVNDGGKDQVRSWGAGVPPSAQFDRALICGRSPNTASTADTSPEFIHAPRGG